MVDDDLVEDLREALRLTGETDSFERVRLSLALACQLYYAEDRRSELTALVDHGLAIAQRLDDAELTRWAARSASIALWRSDTRLGASPPGRAGTGRGPETGRPRRRGPSPDHRHRDRPGTGRSQGLPAAYGRGVAVGSATATGLPADRSRVHRGVVGRPGRRSRPTGARVGADRGVPTDLGGQPRRVRQLARLLDHAVEPGRPQGPPGRDGGRRPRRSQCARRRCGRPRIGPPRPAGRRPRPAGPGVAQSADQHVELDLGRGVSRRNRLRPRRPQSRRAGRPDPAPALRPAGDRRRLLVGGPLDGYLALAEAALGNRPAATAAADRALEQARAWDMSAYVRWLMRHRAGGSW